MPLHHPEFGRHRIRFAGVDAPDRIVDGVWVQRDGVDADLRGVAAVHLRAGRRRQHLRAQADTPHRDAEFECAAQQYLSLIHI